MNLLFFRKPNFIILSWVFEMEISKSLIRQTFTYRCYFVSLVIIELKSVWSVMTHKDDQNFKVGW